jgi:RNA polymerase sigma-70 factor, ECF subfamily
MTAVRKIDYEAMDDLALAALISARDVNAVRLVTSRYNQRLFRAAWGILKSRADAEDAVQSAYLKAFAAIATFKGAATLSTWLTRIVINEALGRVRAEKRRRASLDPGSVVHLDRYREELMRGSAAANGPDQQIAIKQIRGMIEQAVSRLPSQLRLVFILHHVEDMSVDEAARVLGIVPATVKTRLFRARQLLRQELAPELATALADSFPFAGADCARLTARIVARLAWSAP